ncbi:hypothetical protein M231_02538 [Tremella mesenterica]|uniref:Uncharacterized protein n=1 Tax=Tremella mesenterica TaxID=5217 RepID=A0A4Q1BQ72_TREME|nr:hypothetical protein M231_02538 [Tremella mesenterica]
MNGQQGWNSILGPSGMVRCSSEGDTDRWRVLRDPMSLTTNRRSSVPPDRQYGARCQVIGTGVEIGVEEVDEGYSDEDVDKDSGGFQLRRYSSPPLDFFTGEQLSWADEVTEAEEERQAQMQGGYEEDEGQGLDTISMRMTMMILLRPSMAHLIFSLSIRHKYGISHHKIMTTKNQTTSQLQAVNPSPRW